MLTRVSHSLLCTNSYFCVAAFHLVVLLLIFGCIGVHSYISFDDKGKEGQRRAWLVGKRQRVVIYCRYVIYNKSVATFYMKSHSHKCNGFHNWLILLWWEQEASHHQTPEHSPT
jgi:heme/copper-type cytochrome/quinol oxidase subunit 1